MLNRRGHAPQLLLLFAVTAVFCASYVWLSWRLVEQDRALERQRAVERVRAVGSAVADDLTARVAAIDADLARIAEDDGASAASFAERLPADSVVVVVEQDGIVAFPPGRLPYLPRVVVRESDTAAFEAAEALELGSRDYAGAIARLRPLTDGGGSLRAGALVRIARNLRKAGRLREALQTYERLTELRGIPVDNSFADLLGAYGRCLILEEMQSTELRETASALLRDLDRGAWKLDWSAWQFYRAECARWLGTDLPPLPAVQAALVDAATALDTEHARGEPAGTRELRTGRESLLLIWRATPERFVGVAAGPRMFEPSQYALASSGISARLTPGEAARRDGAVHAQAVPPLPWLVEVSGGTAAAISRSSIQARLLALTGVAAAVLLALTTYFAGRAMVREMKLARLQSDFVAAVSHDFRTPLTSIRQLSEMLAEGRVVSEERRAEYHEQLRWESERLQGLVEELLDFKRMEAGASPERFDQVSPADVVREVVEDFTHEAASRGHAIELDAPEAVPLVRGDREMLRRALWNLLDNAVKYSPESDVIDVAVTPGRTDVRISVRDRGVGIGPHERESIFERFVRADSARLTGARGSGLGLSMVRDIAAAHGGSVEVESEPGKGSTFTIILPAAGRS